MTTSKSRAKGNSRKTLDTESIALLRANGLTLQAIADEAGITKARVWQILKERKKKMAKRFGDDREFAATNLSPEVKDALRRRSEQTGESMSTLIAEAVEKALREAGLIIIKPTT